MTTALLEVRDLAVSYGSGPGAAHAVDGATLDVPRGETLGLVGESGCGKSTLVRALMGVLPPGARVLRGSITFDGADLLLLPPERRRAMLWRDMAFVPQTAMNALDPVYRLREQMREVLCRRGGLGRKDADARAAELFRSVGLHPRRLMDYPHQFSGGMRQRASIALALALRPRLVIADEPVTALDVVVQRQVLDLLLALGRDRPGRESPGQRLREHTASAIVVTHDISVVAYLCDATAVMYAGRVVEYGPTADVLERPAHPYTMGLMNAFPDIENEGAVPVAIEGAPPPLTDLPPGCRFAPRCPFAEPACTAVMPEAQTVVGTHWVACRRADEAPALRARALEAATWLH